MARPARRVVIGLAIRLGVAPREVSSWDIADIRDCMALLTEMAKPPEKRPMTDEELEAAFNARCGP